MVDWFWLSMAVVLELVYGSVAPLRKMSWSLSGMMLRRIASSGSTMLLMRLTVVFIAERTEETVPP